MVVSEYGPRGKRAERYREFRIFASCAPQWFREFSENDARHEFFESVSSFYILPELDSPASNAKSVEISYGARPVDHEVSASRMRFVTEQGGTLRYERTVRGTVICVMYPEKCEGFRRTEEAIIIEHISNPRILTSKNHLKRHWRTFLSYCECSSVDGDPTLIDRIIVEWLMFVKPVIYKDKVEERRVTTAAKWVLKWTLTVGLSGALLSLFVSK
tara:strand:- start:102 stop:746 length:645 start_codon:yes stop_codon:yes gene_type:complete